MNRWIAPLAVAAVMLAGSAVLLSCGESPSPATNGTLTARKVERSPEFSAALTGAWKAAPVLEVATKHDDAKAGPTVELRALHDGETLWLMARWPDETRSTTKKAWVFTGGAWTKAAGDEDRFAVAIDGNVPEFPVQGCAVLCHDGSMGSGSADAHADLWHWKAARGGLSGFADDQHFAMDRENDDGGGSYAGNATEDKAAPRWIWADGADRSGDLTAENSMEMPADYTAEEGYRVPSVRLRTPEGSRGDVESVAVHRDGWWTVVLERRLDTGHADDSVLTPGTTAHLAVAVFDDTGASEGDEHAKSGPVPLTLE